MTDTDSTSPLQAKGPLVILQIRSAKDLSSPLLRSLERRLGPERLLLVGRGAHSLPEGHPGALIRDGDWWEWLEELGLDSSGGLILLDAGLDLPPRFLQRVEQALDARDCPALFTLPGSHQDGLDPAGMRPTNRTAIVDSLVQAAAWSSFAPVHLQPKSLAIIAPGRLSEALTLVRNHQTWIHDALWVGGALSARQGRLFGPDLQAALGHVQAALSELSAEDWAQPLPLFGLDGRPVILHITHDWGGGVARWIADLLQADTQHHHLVLASGGHSDGHIHGQWMTLYGRGPKRLPLGRWPLNPAIDSTLDAHAGHAALLQRLVRRFGVSAVVVSSLIGHSLDALRSGLPTLQMLHDYYPAWPVLEHDPLRYINAQGEPDYQAAIAASGPNFLFEERRASVWQKLARRWLQIVQAQNIPLVAPSTHVLSRWRRLLDDALPQAHVLGHGFPGWPEGVKTSLARPLADGRLNLVLVGRLSPGKGLRLLQQALDLGLGRYARITLLGCGQHGMALFGRANVDIVLEYEQQELPAHLAKIGAQAALFLSTVPETWNYVLSETRALGLVPIATRLGSFVERIRDGEDGLLFQPDAQALVDLLEALQARPEQLEQLRQQLPAERSMADALAGLYTLLQPAAAQAAPPQRLSSDRLLFARTALQATEARRALQNQRQKVDALSQDLEQRTQWARRHERLAAERTHWARELEQQRQALAAHVEQLQEQEQLQQAQHLAQLQMLEQRLKQVQEQARQQNEKNKAHTQQLQAHLEAVVRSRSWRLTRPLRVSTRLLRNALTAQAWAPWRWPQLLNKLRLNARQQGWRSAFYQLQQLPAPAQPAAAQRTITVSPQLDEIERRFRLGPVRFELPESPEVSIIIPVYNKVEYTANCLNSLLEHGSRLAAEIIVINDASSDDTAQYLERCHGLRVLHNAENSGFIESCNRGADAARGHYLVFLNNDTTVTSGWLDTLIETFDSRPRAGVVGARLIYPDGRLQEAGGIIFSDASGWNYGRRDLAELPQYNFVSEADYVSGACLAIRRAQFHALGGFDTRYKPAYYEDTDLCFAVRAAGQEVIYQPGTTIVHHEGISSGTDESSGTKRYQAVNREKFAEKWQEVLASHPDAGQISQRPDPVRHLRYRRYQRRMLLLDAITPRPDQDSGSVRMAAIMQLLVELGYLVSFAPQNLAWDGDYSRWLQQQGIEVLHAPAVPDLESWLAEHGHELDLVLASRHYVLASMLKAIQRHCPQAQLIFDTVDLHFLREQREAELLDNPEIAAQAEQSREQELALARQADITLVVSPVEQKLLARLLPHTRVDILSNVHQVHGCNTAFDQRQGLLFVGGFQHIPNVDAALWLVQDILPRIRQELPEVELHLIGSRMPPEIATLRAPGLVVHGFVADLEPYLNGCRLSLAPLRYGAGVKGKVNQAMSYGLPVVATSCAAEGMFIASGHDALVADTAEDFAAAVVRAYRDPELWQQLSRGGLENVSRWFSMDAARDALRRILELEPRKPAPSSQNHDAETHDVGAHEA